jgi:hypothetical protein
MRNQPFEAFLEKVCLKFSRKSFEVVFYSQLDFRQLQEKRLVCLHLIR